MVSLARYQTSLRSLLLLALVLMSSHAAAFGWSTVFGKSKDTAHISFNPCVDTVGEMRCGILDVPEERGASDSRRLKLSFAVIAPTPLEASAVRNERRPTLIILNGGPGGSSFGSNGTPFRHWHDMAIRFQQAGFGDVILFSQRGTKDERSEELSCPVNRDPRYFLGAAETPSEVRDWRAMTIQSVRMCRNRAIGAGVPLEAYSTAANMHDVLDLQKLLHLNDQRWMIYGVSYGARLAVKIAETKPAGLSGLVLDSPDLPGGRYRYRRAEALDSTLLALDAHCASLESCRYMRYPPRSLVLWLIEAFEREPTVIKMTIGDQIVYSPLGASQFIDLVIRSFYDRSLIDRLPTALASATRKDYSKLAAIASTVYDPEQSVVFGTNASIKCQDGQPLDLIEHYREQARHYPFFQPYLADLKYWQMSLCPTWLPGFKANMKADHGALKAKGMGKDKPGTKAGTSTPTLVLSGALDPITPVAHDPSALKHIPGAQVKHYAAATHGVLFSLDCAWDDIAAFVSPGEDGYGGRSTGQGQISDPLSCRAWSDYG